MINNTIKLDKKDLERVKELALDRYKSEAQGDLTSGQFMALCYLHACNVFFCDFGFDARVMFELGPYYDPTDDRIN